MVAVHAGKERRLRTLLFGAAATAGVALLAWACVQVNLQRTCAIGDTPYLDLCPSPPSNTQRITLLRERIAANAGDTNAYIQLGWLDTSAARPQSIDAAARLAPADPNVHLIRAAAALDRQDWTAAVKPLVDLTEHRGHHQSAVVLARFIASGQSQLLSSYLLPGTKWFQQVLTAMPQAQGAFASALPLVALALERRVLEPDLLARYITQLKQGGAWADAYSLWVVLHEGATPVLYNAGFDQPLRADGFDWEITTQGRPSQAGAWVERNAADKRGPVLDIRFSGRAMAMPLVQQTLFVAPGRYRLRGEYKANQLRMEQGLAWVVRCSAVPTQLSPAKGLMDTGGAWQAFEFEFSIPANCGLVANLRLETLAAFEAAVGSRGRASFDSLVLEKLER